MNDLPYTLLPTGTWQEQRRSQGVGVPHEIERPLLPYLQAELAHDIELL